MTINKFIIIGCSGTLVGASLIGIIDVGIRPHLPILIAGIMILCAAVFLKEA